MKTWRRIAVERLQSCRVFDVESVRFAPDNEGEEAKEFFVVQAPDWINVIPLTAERHVVLVRQYRVGAERVTLEIPGGMCDPGEPPSVAASRELLEETGYKARELKPLGWVHPNPAIQTNRCHSYVALDAYPAGPARPDPGEELEVVSVPLAEVPDLIADGTITHSLVVSAFHLLGLQPAG